MKSTNLSTHTDGDTLAAVKQVHWSHQVAAASLVAGAVLLITGRKQAALIVAATGAATTLLEEPEEARELWSKLPAYIRQGQDFLVKAEGMIERVGEQAARLRETMGRQG
ncbi:hypothetical protein [Acidipila sp. EB88]|uniref:hypothetical protein n=1 Tax=Acidipila sp. EB88 TaxID=2305226 RepID=UPI000F5DD20A|nr:hypothetical protein [Acidipila sp. EB88]RRA47400.1 hypothetical protein D1Y84_02910 [Acidipila sp. EB88]